MRINPYLVFRGNAEEALTFYAGILNGKLEIMRYSEMPGDMEMPKEMANAVMHAGIKVNDEVLLMGTDSFEGMGPKFNYGDSFFVSCDLETDAEAERVFTELSAGGKVLRKLEKQFWGDKFGMCVDKYGTYWMINHITKK